MEPSEFLDILGNENRRKILALLADRPYYVSEISTRLGVAPKAVIGHLSLLENSGLIENNTDDQRRKYYSISKSLRLEVSVSPILIPFTSIILNWKCLMTPFIRFLFRLTRREPHGKNISKTCRQDLLFIWRRLTPQMIFRMKETKAVDLRLKLSDRLIRFTAMSGF